MNLSQFNRILLQTLLLPVIALAFVAALLALQVAGAHRTVDSIQVSDDIIADATRLQALIVDQETGLRGYQITSDAAFLQPYTDAEVPIDSLLNELRAELRAQHQDISPVDRIADAHTTWQIAFARPLVASIAAGGTTADTALNMHGKSQMDELRAALADLLAREGAIRRDEATRWSRQYHRVLLALVVLVLAAGILISVFTLSRIHRVTSAYQGTLDGLRRHSQATFESEERLRTILSSIGDGVIVCDPRGCVEMMNTSAQLLLGLPQAETTDRALNDVLHMVHETSREPLESPVARVLRLRKVVGRTERTILLRRDGTEIFVDDSGAPIYDRNGQLSGVVMVIRDVTEQRKTQEALLSAEKLATAGRLAATIAHEMHNPLDSVVNLLYLLRDEKDAAISANYLDMAQGELDRMGQVSRAMLGLYRESKAPVALNVKEVVESVLTLLDRQFKDAFIEVRSDIPPDLQIEGYPAEFRQVLTNLLVNSADAAAGPGAWLRVSAAPSRKPSPTGRGTVLIEISDNGSGIEPSALQHIFEPFFTTKGERGTGLGLWVSRGILDKHDGHIDVQSRTAPDDHGTVITLTLPRARI